MLVHMYGHLFSLFIKFEKFQLHQLMWASMYGYMYSGFSNRTTSMARVLTFGLPVSITTVLVVSTTFESKIFFLSGKHHF
jgi:hypothetical protein